MESRNSLARLADVAGGAVPLLERLRATARHAAEELKTRLLGRDFEQRVEVLKGRYIDLGGVPFGFDVDTARNAAVLLAFFHRMYFRTEVFGIEHVPAGRVLLIANHSGQVPIDAAIVGSSLFFDASPPRVVRAMVEKWTATLPFVSAFFNRVGQVVGVPENARRLLEMGEVLLEIPVFPLIPQLFVPGAQMPLPTKYRIHFGEPMRFEGGADDDDALIAEKVYLVRQTISEMLRRGLASRRSVFL